LSEAYKELMRLTHKVKYEGMSLQDAVALQSGEVAKLDRELVQL